ASAAKYSAPARVVPAFPQRAGRSSLRCDGNLSRRHGETCSCSPAQLGFFRAPVAGIVCMHRDLGPADALSVGMFLQTLLLALTERGLGSCVEVSISGYPEIVRAQLAIPTELSILCGLAIGYPDPEFPANKLHIAREPIGENVVFLDN